MVFGFDDGHGPTFQDTYCALIVEPGTDDNVTMTEIGKESTISADQLVFRAMVHARAATVERFD